MQSLKKIQQQRPAWYAAWSEVIIDYRSRRSNHMPQCKALTEEEESALYFLCIQGDPPREEEILTQTKALQKWEEFMPKRDKAIQLFAEFPTQSRNAMISAGIFTKSDVRKAVREKLLKRGQGRPKLRHFGPGGWRAVCRLLGISEDHHEGGAPIDTNLFLHYDAEDGLDPKLYGPFDDEKHAEEFATERHTRVEVLDEYYNVLDEDGGYKGLYRIMRAHKPDEDDLGRKENCSG